jgi:hypothetical protein
MEPEWLFLGLGDGLDQSQRDPPMQRGGSIRWLSGDLKN